jgi:hypothetical protein
MNRKNALMPSLILAAGLFCATTPAYAHWGSASPWAFAANNQDADCSHTHANSASHTRTARVKARRHFIDLGCEVNPITGQCVPFFLLFDDATVTNRSSNSRTADVIFFGWDANNPPGGFLPYLASFDDLPVNSSRSLAAAVDKGTSLWNLQAACQVTSDMI